MLQGLTTKKNLKKIRTFKLRTSEDQIQKSEKL